MTDGDSRSRLVLGFFTVLEHEQLGLVGGYLLLGAAGRPLEFHCTAPVKPNRAQQILFGPTLGPYLYGEQIGQTLVSQAAREPAVVRTDHARAMAVADFVSPPVALVLPRDDAPAAALGAPWRVEPPLAPEGSLSTFAVGRNRLAVPAHRATDQHAIAEQLAELGEFDLSEPFARIREAIDEAQRNHRAA